MPASRLPAILLPVIVCMVAVLSLAACAGLQAGSSAGFGGGSPQYQQCIKYGSASYCEDEIYGDGS